jgi:hypothetical protein
MAETVGIQTSESITDLSAALVEFSERDIKFLARSKNPHFGNAYATLPFVLHSVVQPLASVGLSVVQGGALVEGQFAIITRLIHRSGQWLETIMPIQPSEKALTRDACQAYASAATYGRRIALLAILGLAPVDPKERDLLEVDDDGNTASGKSEKVDPQFEADYAAWFDGLLQVAEQPTSTTDTLGAAIKEDHPEYGDKFRLRLKANAAVEWKALKAKLPKQKES